MASEADRAKRKIEWDKYKGLEKLSIDNSHRYTVYDAIHYFTRDSVNGKNETLPVEAHVSEALPYAPVTVRRLSNKD